jgi:hypothetical protein
LVEKEAEERWKEGKTVGRKVPLSPLRIEGIAFDKLCAGEEAVLAAEGMGNVRIYAMADSD